MIKKPVIVLEILLTVNSGFKDKDRKSAASCRLVLSNSPRVSQVNLFHGRSGLSTEKKLACEHASQPQHGFNTQERHFQAIL